MKTLGELHNHQVQILRNHLSGISVLEKDVVRRVISNIRELRYRLEIPKQSICQLRIIDIGSNCFRINPQIPNTTIRVRLRTMYDKMEARKSWFWRFDQTNSPSLGIVSLETLSLLELSYASSSRSHCSQEDTI